MGWESWGGRRQQSWSDRLSPGVSQAGKFGLIPTTITLGTGAAWLGVVSVANVGSLWPQTARAQTRLHAH